MPDPDPVPDPTASSITDWTQWQSVRSSNVLAVRREGKDLLVMFKGGRIWQYPGAGVLLADMLAAPSKGKYVHHVLRPRFGDGSEIR